MPSTFKVWIHIEEIDDDADLCEDVGEPWAVGEFDTLEEAEALRQKLSEYSDDTAYRCGDCGHAFPKGDMLENVLRGTRHCPSCVSEDLRVMPVMALEEEEE